MSTDTYHWRGYTRDGATIEEYDDAGLGSGFGRVDQSSLAALELVPQQPGLSPRRVLIPADARPILFRRRQIVLNTETGTQGAGATITVIGFQKTIEGRNTKALLACYDDGSILLTDDSEAL